MGKHCFAATNVHGKAGHHIHNLKHFFLQETSLTNNQIQPNKNIQLKFEHKNRQFYSLHLKYIL